MPNDGAPRIAILGGGLTGAALAMHALRGASGPLAIDVVEPAAELGRGAAYGTTDPAHRINVPSHRMSLFPDDPGHLTRWLFDRGVLPDAASTVDEGDHYVPRGAFGAYAADALARAAAARPCVRCRRWAWGRWRRCTWSARGGGGTSASSSTGCRGRARRRDRPPDR